MHQEASFRFISYMKALVRLVKSIQIVIRGFERTIVTLLAFNRRAPGKSPRLTVVLLLIPVQRRIG